MLMLDMGIMLICAENYQEKLHQDTRSKTDFCVLRCDLHQSNGMKLSFSGNFLEFPSMLYPVTFVHIVISGTRFSMTAIQFVGRKHMDLVLDVIIEISCPVPLSRLTVHSRAGIGMEDNCENTFFLCGVIQ